MLQEQERDLEDYIEDSLWQEIWLQEQERDLDVSFADFLRQNLWLQNKWRYRGGSYSTVTNRVLHRRLGGEAQSIVKGVRSIVRLSQDMTLIA